MLALLLFSLVTVVALPSLNVSSITTTRVCVVVLAATSAVSYNASTALSLGSGVSLYNGLMQVTSTSYTVDVLLGVIGAAALSAWAPFTYAANNYTGSVFTLVPLNSYYSLLAVFSVTGSSLLVSSASLMCLYLSLEVQSFAVYVLATLYRESETATDAGLTYFLLGGLSSCLILLGSAQIYASLGVTSLEQVYVVVSAASSVSSMVAFSLTVLAAGLCFKVAAAPFHQWAPGVYDRVPTVVTAWLQTMPKLAVLGLLTELTGGLTLVSSSLEVELPLGSVNAWTDTLMVVAMLSIVIGSVLGLAQTRVKRLLTYSTVSHVGFMLLALAAYNTDAVASFTFYLVQYSVTSLASLMVLLAIGYVAQGRATSAQGSDIELLSELTGMVKAQPMLSLGFAVLLFSMAGVPPFVGFFAKQGVLEASLTAHYGGLAVIAIVMSVLSASYYLKIVRLMQFSTSSAATRSSGQPLTAVHTFTIAVILMLVTLYLLLPSSFLDSTRTLALTVTTL